MLRSFDKPHPLLLSVPPLILFAILSAPLSKWLVDDALISFTYARNLAEGFGLVAQPGRPPVEGFSNPLWTLLFVPIFWLSSNVPLWPAKFLGLVFTFGTFVFGCKIVYRITSSGLVGMVAMALLATDTSFVVWNVSGLENALYGFEVAALTYMCLATIDDPSRRLALAAGLLAAAAALTRPDGVVFFVLWPLALIVRLGARSEAPAGVARPFFTYLAAFAVPTLAYKAAALAYFGSIVPNTYYAKGGPTFTNLRHLLAANQSLLAKGFELVRAPFGFGWATLFVFAACWAAILATKRHVAPLLMLSAATALALLIYILLPFDWMAEYRFATPFFALVYPTVISVLWVAGDALPVGKVLSRRAPVIALLTVMAWVSVANHQFRLIRFYRDPTVPYAEIAELYGKRFNRAAEILGLDHASLLLPDLGGSLFYSKLKLIDLAGLTDPTIAKNLRTNKPALYDYIFNQVKPTFIHTREYWAAISDLDASNQFRADYLPLREAVDPEASAYAGRTIYSGDYVRRDSVAGRAAALTQIRAALYGTPLPNR